MMQAIRATRPGGHVGYVGVPHGVELSAVELFFSHINLHGGPAPVRRFLPELVELICDRTIDPGKVFALELPLEQAAGGLRGHGRTTGHQGPPHGVGRPRTLPGGKAVRS
jgi:threonine dehydrogenase-like Zn-dependent dehydrogenase